MGKKTALLLIILISLVMLVTICWAVTAQQRSPSQLRFQAGTVPLKPYQDPGTETYSLVLPAFSQKEDLTASHGGMGSLDFSSDGQTYDSLGQVPLDQAVTVTVSFPWGAEDTYTLRLMQASTRQTIYLETKDGTIDLVNASQDHEASVSVTIWDEAGQPEYQGHAAISGRGNGTWNWEKKPYDLKFPETVTVGSFQNVDKLCLLAEFVDDSKLRNALAYHTGQLLDIPYASGYLYADLYIDGTYQGIYALTTKREYTKHISSDGIQSVFELSSSNKGNFFYTDHGKQIRIHHGQQEDILYAVENFEDALMDRDWTALWQTADLTSWARKYAMDEFFYNYDLPLTSQYFCVDTEGKIKCVLPWDYEWVFYPRMSPYDFSQEQAFAAFYSHGNWYEILLENEAFRLEAARILREEFTPQLFAAMEDYMDECVQELTGSWHCDRYRWNSSYAAAPGTDGGEGTMRWYAGLFRGYFEARRDFMIQVLENWDDYCVLLFFSEAEGARYQSNLQLIVPKGTLAADYQQNIIDTLTNLGPNAPVSITAQDGTALENVGIITENMVITAVY